jgi:hypothetical protein
VVVTSLADRRLPSDPPWHSSRVHVRVTSIDRGGDPGVVDLERWLAGSTLRVSNWIHAETRVFTCRGSREPYELDWSARQIPGEELLGGYGPVCPAAVVERVTAELMTGRAVRLYVFNSDADLCWQDLLEPTT